MLSSSAAVGSAADAGLEWWDEQPESTEDIVASSGDGTRQRTRRVALRISLEPLRDALGTVWRHSGWQKSIIAMFVVAFAAVPFVYRLGSRGAHSAVAADGVASSLHVSKASASDSQLANAPSTLGGNAAPHESVTNGYKPSETLNFVALVPATEPQLAKLGSKAYDSTHGEYTFDDLYMGEPVRVSEELIPSGFDAATAVKDATGSVMRAPEPFTAPGGTGYVGNSTTTGAQVVVAAQRGILVFVQSQYQHPGYAWQQYLSTLQ